jgi:hypothetical protein
MVVEFRVLSLEFSIHFQRHNTVPFKQKQKKEKKTSTTLPQNCDPAEVWIDAP